MSLDRTSLWSVISCCHDGVRSSIVAATLVVHQSVLMFWGTTAPHWARASLFTMFLDHTQRRTTFGRTPLDKWSARRRDLYLTTHNTCNRQDIHAPGGIRNRNPPSERPHPYAVDGPAAGTIILCLCLCSF